MEFRARLSLSAFRTISVRVGDICKWLAISGHIHADIKAKGSGNFTMTAKAVFAAIDRMPVAGMQTMPGGPISLKAGPLD